MHQYIPGATYLCMRCDRTVGTSHLAYLDHATWRPTQLENRSDYDSPIDLVIGPEGYSHSPGSVALSCPREYGQHRGTYQSRTVTRSRSMSSIAQLHDSCHPHRAYVLHDGWVPGQSAICSAWMCTHIRSNGSQLYWCIIADLACQRWTAHIRSGKSPGMYRVA